MADLENQTESPRIDREYAWKYFQFHAEQRLKTFNFFLVISTVIFGAILTIIKETSSFFYAIPISCLLFLLSFIFWKIDQRNKELIFIGENALKDIEELIKKTKPLPQSCCIFLNEESTTNVKKSASKFSLFKSHFSISDCFNIVFFVFGILGLSIALLLSIIYLIQ